MMFFKIFYLWIQPACVSLKMCHETTGQIGVKFAPELIMAGLSVTPAHMERQEAGPLHGPLTQNTICRG